MTEFGATVRAIRKRKRLTQTQVADYMGITLRGYQNYERGRRLPDIEKAGKMAEVLGVTLDELYRGSCKTESA